MTNAKLLLLCVRCSFIKDKLSMKIELQNDNFAIRVQISS